MAIKPAAFMLFGMLLMQKVFCLLLVANYKYWRSVSSGFIYDYSGSARHGFIFGDFIATDRGISPYIRCRPSLLSYAFLSSNEYTISFWSLNHNQDSSFNVSFGYRQGTQTRAFYVDYRFDVSGDTTLFFFDQVTYSHTVSNIQGWNFHTVRMYQSINSITGNIRVYFQLYLNLSSLYSTQLDLSINQFDIVYLEMVIDDLIENIGLIMYESWVHLELSSISELSDLISTSCSCGNGCPTSPSIACLPINQKFENKAGSLCSSACTDSKLSCDTSNTCISDQKYECLYRLYDLASSECLFYCPGNSCSCSTSYTLNIFRCTCRIGYKSVSSNPHACISNRCLTYHAEGYKYVCDSTETGYTLDANGDCCICDSDYTQLLTNPLVCMNILHCIEYTPSETNYIYVCLTCEEGYSVDSNGSCNRCDTNYAKLSDNPFTCGRHIENCVEYFYDAGDYKCLSCSPGYLLDANGSCSLCNSDYFVYSQFPFKCAKLINNCSQIVFDGTESICHECNPGFKLNLSGNECDEGIRHCIAYTIIDNIEVCIKCSDGYQVDADGNCNM